MAKARIIIKRRKAVRNIKKITKVMQMIATSRYQKAYKRAVGTKPYVRKIGELVASAVQAVRASGQARCEATMAAASSAVPRISRCDGGCPCRSAQAARWCHRWSRDTAVMLT